MEHQMVLFLCWKFLMIQRDMLIKVEEKEKDHLPFTLSLGMLTFFNFYSLKKIMVKNRIEPVTYFTLCGYRICLCKELLMIKIGLWCVLINAQACKIHGVNNLIFYLPNMKDKVKGEKHLKPDNCGKQLWIHKYKQEHLICFIKTHVIENLTNKT